MTSIARAASMASAAAFLLLFVPCDRAIALQQARGAGLLSSQHEQEGPAGIRQAGMAALENYLEVFQFPQLPHQPQIAQYTGVAPAGPAFTGGISPERYVLGAGDEIQITLLGKLQKQFPLRVLADGTVSIMPAGPIRLGGLTLSAAQHAIARTLKKFYTGVQVHVNLVQPRQITIEIYGEVYQPGQYTLPAHTSMMTALRHAGGLTPLGSWRAISITSPDSGAGIVDLYPLIFANKSVDPALQEGMKIFVPAQQHFVAVAGFIARPGIYQLGGNGEEPLADLLQWAGGLPPLADSAWIAIQRFRSDGTRRFFRTSLGEDGMSVPVRHGDIVRIFPREHPAAMNQVRIWGEVRRPGEYAYSEGMRLSDVIRLAGGLKIPARHILARIRRVQPVSRDTTIQVTLHTQPANGMHGPDPLLGPYDHIFIRRDPRWQQAQTVLVEGEVQLPGVYAIEKDATRLSEVLARAGGLTDFALASAVIIRRKVPAAAGAGRKLAENDPAARDFTDKYNEDLYMRSDLARAGEIRVDLTAPGDSGKAHDLLLQSGDVIHVPHRAGEIFVAGKVGRPGAVPFVPAADLDYYLQKAGNVLWNAEVGDIKIIRADGSVVPADAAAALRAGDTIWVPPQNGKTWWEHLRDIVSLGAQLATIYLVIYRGAR